MRCRFPYINTGLPLDLENFGKALNFEMDLENLEN